MPTPIRLFNARHEVFQVSTSAWATLKDEQQRRWRQLHEYQVRYPQSLEEFGEPPSGNENYFIRDLKSILATPKHQWQGPLWHEFIQTLRENPNQVWIITARLHAPLTIWQGLEYLYQEGWIPAIPQLSQIWPVAHSEFPSRFHSVFGTQVPGLDGAPHTHWSTYKSCLISKLLHEIVHDAKYPASSFLVKFSDDDSKNIKTICETLPSVLSKFVAAPHQLDIQVYLTSKPTQVVAFSSKGNVNGSPSIPITLYQGQDARAASSDQGNVVKGGKALLPPVKLNTSNLFKLGEFQRLLAPFAESFQSTQFDLPEPEADPITVIRYKATQVPMGVLCDDASLEVPCAAMSPSTNIRWSLDQLGSLVNQRALFVSMLAVRKGDQVYIYRGEVWGTLQQKNDNVPCPAHAGFLPWFCPDALNGRYTTELIANNESYDHVNARYYAIQDYLNQKPYMICPKLDHWDGAFQQEH
jgi:inosine/xanthosine triphosphate pyrophosphatase family protein